MQTNQIKCTMLSVTVVITFKAIQNELCTECSFSAIELNVWQSVMREQASAAERRASAVSLSSVPSPQRSSYYVLSHMNFWAVVERNAYLFCAIGLQMEL